MPSISGDHSSDCAGVRQVPLAAPGTTARSHAAGLRGAAQALARDLRLFWWACRSSRPDGPLAAIRCAIDDRRVIARSGLFDADWYRSAYPDVVAAGLDALAHFTAFGGSQRRDPSALFDTAWYLDQNPGVAASGENPLVHYLRVGAAAGQDPGPLFDTLVYVASQAGAVAPENALAHFLRSGRDVAPGAYRSAEALRARQERYLARTETRLCHDLRGDPRRFAVLLQCGSGSVHAQWLHGGPRQWDLIVNHYDHAFRGAIPCEVELHQAGELPGTKFTATHAILARWPNLLAGYDFVLLLDDDVVMPVGGVERLFAVADEEGLDQAQASLSTNSFGTFDVFRNPGSAGVRPVRGVEIMMPVLSRRALRAARPLFAETISGWGLDYALAELMSRAPGSRAAVIDAVVAQHTKAVDPSGGAYYRMLAREEIYPRAELHSLMKKYGVRWRGFAQS